MKALPNWYRNGAVLRAIGLKLVTVRRFGQKARWISCRACGEGLVALWCSDCRWSLEAYMAAHAHLAALRRLDPLHLFRCPSGCNTALVEQPDAVLVAQAEEATFEKSSRSYEATEGRRKGRAAAR